MKTIEVKERLEYLRKELREERISYGELAELQSLVEHIDSNDVELLQAAGVPEEEYNKLLRIDQAKELWEELGNTPVNEDMELDEEFNPKGFDAVFEIGTDCFDVWHWFEETFDLSVAKDLMGLD